MLPQMLSLTTKFSYPSHLETELGFVRCGRYIPTTNGMAVRSIKGRYPMKTKILAAAAAFAMIVGAAQAFAQNANQAHDSESSNVNSQCANILANPEAYSPADVKYCKAIS
jgi:hypothetical protein